MLQLLKRKAFKNNKKKKKKIVCDFFMLEGADGRVYQIQGETVIVVAILKQAWHFLNILLKIIPVHLHFFMENKQTTAYRYLHES